MPGKGPNRRHVLAGLAAVSIARPVAASPISLRPAPSRVQLAPEGYGLTDVWAFSDEVPGPLLRGRQGERMQVRVENGLAESTSVHWHGLRLENAMDGVPGLTQKAIEPGGLFDYDFRLPDAGTYWYHSHQRSFEQVARGLYGPLIVDEAEPPEVDADEVLVLDDWRLVGEGEIAGDFGAIFDKAHGGRIGNWVTVNGRGEWTKPAARGMRMRLRLINVANGRIFRLRFAGMRAAVVALDGQPVARPEAAEDIVLAPAQRADLIVDVVADEGGEAVILSRERDGDFAVASFPVEAGRAPRPEPFPALPPNAVPVPSMDEIAGAPVRELRMEGGAMGAMMSARADGAETDMRTLAGRGLVWALNGTAGMSEEPFAEIARGTVVRMALRNETAWPHGMHLHGHHFLEIDAGRAAALRDTTLVEPRETREIAFVADNPGDWLVHCHMLEHADGGMMTWIRVT